MRFAPSILLCVALATAGCGGVDPPDAGMPARPEPVSPSVGPGATPTPATTTPATPTPATPTPAPAVATRPPWLGARVLPLRPDGFGEVRDTPPELVDRRLPPPPSALPPPPPDGGFASTIEPVPAAVAARSTWAPDCPVALEDLRYLTVTFWGFDDRSHTGELLVHASAAEDLVVVLRRLYAARFPIEEMRVVTAAELDAPPTGDGNNTTAFVCRPVTGRTTWSQHAYGLAVDINPFHNPYVREAQSGAGPGLVLPELASAYTDRDRRRPGMILAGDAVTEAFAAIGWGWGGDWESLTDPMHFSASGR